MSPYIQRRSGPAFIDNKTGDKIEPRAMIAQCEGCGYEHAAEGMKIDGKRFAYCGVVDGKPACIGKAK